MRTIICKRLGDDDGVVAGATPRPCAKCSALVWVSPSSLNIAGEGEESQFICFECWSASTENWGEFMPIRADQVREIQKHFADLN